MMKMTSIRWPLAAVGLLLLLVLLGGRGCSKKTDVTGKWDGTLDYSSVDGIAGKTSRMVISIRQEGDHFTATMATPEEGPQVVPADSVEYKDNVLTMKVSKRLAVITARLSSDGTELRGDFKQKPYDLPLIVKRVTGL